jgi:uroporphyrin-3 C-methyltransferase
MSAQTPQPDNDKQDDLALPEAPRPEHQNPEHQNLASTALGRISLTQMTLAVLVVIFLWQWFDGHRAIGDMQQQLAKKIAEMDGASRANQMLLTQSQGEVRELSANVAALEARYAEAQNQRAALEALYNDLSVSRDETALAEVEQMLLIAGQQLQLSANVKAALIAMQSADARLQRMDRPAFNGLRKAIGQDMDKLRALPSVDITGINLQIDNLIASVDELPLVYQQRVTKKEATVQVATPKDETAWQKLLKDRKFNRTSQINFAPHLPANPIFIVKTMTDSAPRPFPWQKLVASTPKIDAR